MSEPLHPDDTWPWPNPRANPELVGQRAAERTLAQEFRSGRLAHAWLLTGPRGIGKATLAFRFARFVMSGGDAGTLGGALFGGAAVPGDGLAVDLENAAARDIASLAHPDFRLVRRGYDAKKERWREEITVEDVRDTGTFLHLTPARGGWRMAVIDAADDMNPNAANALLKVLEEPPRQALLLLVSHAPGRLLPTLRSRCRTLKLPSLEDGAVAALLGRYMPDLVPDDAAALVRLAEGSIGRALELADAGGPELYRAILGALGTLPRLDVPALHEVAERLGRKDKAGDFRRALELLSGITARIARLAAGAPPGPEAVAGEGALLARLARSADGAAWAGLWTRLAGLVHAVDGLNLDRRLAWIDAILAIEAVLEERASAPS